MYRCAMSKQSGPHHEVREAVLARLHLTPEAHVVELDDGEYVLPDVARHVIGCLLTKDTKAQHVVNDVVSNGTLCGG